MVSILKLFTSKVTYTEQGIKTRMSLHRRERWRRRDGDCFF